MPDEVLTDKKFPENPQPAVAVTVDGQEGKEAETATSVDKSEQKTTPDPTRYGDWEKNGRCIDF